jgi:putative methyltransferase (TIGR04325 family)
VIDRFLKQTFQLIYGPIRDFVNERRFHSRGGGDPIYSGMHETYEAASKSMPTHGVAGFDDAAAVNFFLNHHADLNQFDYPVLYWLNRIYRPGDSIFDFGGGLGQCRYAYQPYLQMSEGSRWLVCDVPALVAKGEELARERGMHDLQFTTDLKDAATTGLFLSNGALQYMQADLPELLKTVATLPVHVLVNRIPVFNGRPYYTVQRTRHGSYTPYRIMNRNEFVTGMEALGYQLRDAWEVQRSLYVNFRPESYVPTYQGFYFSR